MSDLSQSLAAPRYVKISQDGAVRRIVMSRPEVRNAFDPRMITEITAAFVDACSDPLTRVVVLAGAGESFSAGADLEYMRSMAEFDEEQNVEDALRLVALFEAVRDCPKPVVARVQGAAVGGGVGLVAASDIAVAADDTVFAFSEVRLGMIPAVISPFVVPRIGHAASHELFLTGERFDAARAHAINLVARVVPAAELDEAVDERVAALLEAAPEAQGAVKALLRGVAGGVAAKELANFTARLIAERRVAAEGHEGMAAFVERRKPSWVHWVPDAPGDEASES